MTHKLKGILITGAAIAALAAGGGAIAGATGGGHGKKRVAHSEKRGDHKDKRITGGALARASKVALAHTGGGRVTDSEVADEEGYYEIEVVRTDGSQVDVHLDRTFNLIDTSPDGAGDKPSPKGN